MKDTVKILYDYGVKEVHIRPACPALIYPCLFLNFSQSRSTLDLAGLKAIAEIEGKELGNPSEYAIPGTDRHCLMVEKIRQKLGVTTLRYQTLDELIEAIGLPREDVCTHCWDGSSHF